MMLTDTDPMPELAPDARWVAAVIERGAFDDLNARGGVCAHGHETRRTAENCAARLAEGIPEPMCHVGTMTATGDWAWWQVA